MISDLNTTPQSSEMEQSSSTSAIAAENAPDSTNQTNQTNHLSITEGTVHDQASVIRQLNAGNWDLIEQRTTGATQDVNKLMTTSADLKYQMSAHVSPLNRRAIGNLLFNDCVNEFVLDQYLQLTLKWLQDKEAKEQADKKARANKAENKKENSKG